MRNIFKNFTAVDDGLTIFDENELSNAIDMINVEKATIAAVGTFGGATVTVQISTDGTNFVTSGLTIAAAGKVDLTIPCRLVRLSIAGGAGAAITAAIVMRTLD